MGLSCTVSEINGDFSRKFDASAEGVPFEIGYRRLESKRLEWWDYIPERERSWLYLQPSGYIRRTCRQTDRQTDRQTAGDSKDRAYHKTCLLCFSFMTAMFFLL